MTTLSEARAALKGVPTDKLPGIRAAWADDPKVAEMVDEEIAQRATPDADIVPDATPVGRSLATLELLNKTRHYHDSYSASIRTTREALVERITEGAGTSTIVELALRVATFEGKRTVIDSFMRAIDPELDGPTIEPDAALRVLMLDYVDSNDSSDAAYNARRRGASFILTKIAGEWLR